MNKKRSRTRILFLLFLIVILSVLWVAILNFHPVIQIVNSSNTSMDGYQTITYNGEEYEYNNQIRSLMYVGIDSDEELKVSNRYSIAPRADTIGVIVLDDYHKTVKILNISRDTIAEIERFAMNGQGRGTYETQIGYAYLYGDGGKESCNNLNRAVSHLLGDIPIHEYVTINTSGIKLLNSLAGNVTVTVPNDDLVKDYPEFAKGNVVTLDDSNVEAFVRWRDIDIDFSNDGRMRREEAFIKIFFEKLKEKIKEDPDGIWSLIDSSKEHYYTSITRNQYLDLANRLDRDTFDQNNYYYLAGTDAKGDTHDEVILDKDKLQETIIDLFYLKKGASENEP